MKSVIIIESYFKKHTRLDTIRISIAKDIKKLGDGQSYRYAVGQKRLYIFLESNEKTRDRLRRKWEGIWAWDKSWQKHKRRQYSAKVIVSFGELRDQYYPSTILKEREGTKNKQKIYEIAGEDVMKMLPENDPKSFEFIKYLTNFLYYRVERNINHKFRIFKVIQDYMAIPLV